MTFQQYLMLFLLIMMALAFPYYIRANVKTRLRKCNEKNDIEGSLKILDGRLYSYLFGKYAVLWGKIQLFMATNDMERLAETLNAVIDGRFSKKEKNQAISTTFFFFVDAQDKEMCKKQLKFLKDSAKAEEYEFDRAMFRMLVDHSATEDDVEIIKEKLDALKNVKGNHSSQIGIMEYMLGVHYSDNGNKHEAKRYLRDARLHLKDTPYHSKIKKML
ncbi:Uncharacterised protein [uncultured Eubacterium sp.]|nr:Uncharacterised protein [uncultured Eubacterium sp.]